MNDFFNEKKIITQIVLAIFVPMSSGGAIHKKRPSHGLALNCDGEKKYIFDDGTVFKVCKNDLIYLPKHSSYVVESVIPGDMWCINFQCAEDKIFSPCVFHITNMEEVIKMYSSAEKIWTKSKSGREYYVLSELYKILHEIIKTQDAPYMPESRQNLIKPAVNFIHKHYTEELINMQKLSALCGISYDYFRKLFEKFYGISPIKYVNKLKINRAKELLSSGLYTVNEVAFLSGFSDLSHFSRFFKNNVGISPKKFIE